LFWHNTKYIGTIQGFTENSEMSNNNNIGGTGILGGVVAVVGVVSIPCPRLGVEWIGYGSHGCPFSPPREGRIEKCFEQNL